LTVIRRTNAPAQGGGSRTPGDTRLLASCAVFKVRGGAPNARTSSPTTGARRRGAGLSKLNSMRAAPPAPSHSGGFGEARHVGRPDRHFGSWTRLPSPQTTGVGGVPGSRYASAGAVQPLQVLELP